MSKLKFSGHFLPLMGSTGEKSMAFPHTYTYVYVYSHTYVYIWEYIHIPIHMGNESIRTLTVHVISDEE